jgi:hypothetical protein
VGLFLIAAMLLGNGMDRVVWSATPPHFVVWPEPIGWGELAIAAAILLLSAGVWWQLFAGYMLIGCFKSVIVFVTGRDLFAPYGPLPRSESAGLAVFGLATILLMWRFSKNPLTILDRIALTAYVFCLLWRADRATFSDFGSGLIIALACLVFASVIDRIKRRGHGSHTESHVIAH